ncbi:MAG: flagellar biosynthetic protein FliR [Acidobacteriota bacterium]|nr:flagellar biosynthetic protein FliR [Acidobacteriota bacterium]
MQISLVQIFGALLTIGVRLSGMMLFAPFFGSVAIPARAKAMLTLALTALLYPMVSTKLPSAAISQWPMIVFGELLIGIAVGVAANIVFDGVQMAGQILSVQMGLSLVSILDPQTQIESTVVAQFHQTIAMLIFLRLGVHFWLLRALAHSFDYLPPSSGHFGAAFATAALHAGAAVFSIGIQIAAPVLSATLLADIALGLLGKASPQLPLLLLGPAVKSLLGLLVLISALKYWPDLFEHMFLNSIVLADRLLHLAR